MSADSIWKAQEGPENELRLEGEIDFSVSTEVKKFLHEFIKRTDGPVKLDLGELNYLDSSGLAVLLEFRRLLLEANRSLEMTGLSDQVHKLFNLTQVGTLFGV